MAVHLNGNLRFEGKTKIGTPVDIDNSIVYFTQFDTSKPGSGVYTDGDTRVNDIQTNQSSKPTFTVSKADGVKEVRVRWVSGGGGFANGIWIRSAETGLAYCGWYNATDMFTWYTLAVTPVDVGTVSSAGVLEMRLDVYTGECSIYQDDVLRHSSTLNYTPGEEFFMNVFEGSETKTLTVLVPPA